MSKQEDWVDNNFLQRLQTRQVRPGVVHLAMGPAVISRMEQMTEPKTLVQAVGQRWQSGLADQQAQLPFVYAQPAPVETPVAHTAVSTPRATTTVKPSHTQQPIPSLLETGKQAAKSTSTKTQAPVTGKAAAKDTSQTKANATTPTAVSKPTHSHPTKANVTSPTAPLPLAPALSSAPAQKDAALLVPKEVAALETASKASLANQPLPVVKAKPSPPPTAVSPSTPSAIPQKQVVAEPAPTQPTVSRPLVLVTQQPATPSASPQMPGTTTTVPRSKAERPLVRPKTQASTQAPAPPAKPVVKPRSTARKAPITFPSATPDSASTNGRSQFSNPANGPLPIVRTERTQVSQSPPSLPLPKTAVVTPSQPAPTPPAAASSSASGSGVIQRNPTDEAPEATNAPAETVDIDEIVAEVQRQFMRELAIEGERRGVTSWY